MFAKFLISIITIYTAITLAIYFGSNYLIFVPPKSSYSKLQNLLTLKTANGNTISALYLHNPKAKFVILYSHGNNEDLGHIVPALRILYSWGFSVMGYDYEGYGTSQGRPSERSTYADIDAAYNYLIEQKKIAPQRIILFGRSLGSGPSIELATKNPVGGVILESAFISTYRVITKYPIFIFDKYTNIAKINKVMAPILFIHGMQDSVVPFWHGQELYNEFQGKKEYCWVEGVGHNDISIRKSQIKRAIVSFIQGLNS